MFDTDPGPVQGSGKHPFVVHILTKRSLPTGQLSAYTDRVLFIGVQASRPIR
jgi:hypothetical protein